MAKLYKMRGRDDGRTAPGYVTWGVNDDPDFEATQATAENTDPPLLGTIIADTVVVVNQSSTT